MKECPLCGETMRLHAREVRDRPGVNSAVKLLREWICPECDYFEEAEAGEGERSLTERRGSAGARSERSRQNQRN